MEPKTILNWPNITLDICKRPQRDPPDPYLTFTRPGPGPELDNTKYIIAVIHHCNFFRIKDSCIILFTKKIPSLKLTGKVQIYDIILTHFALLSLLLIHIDDDIPDGG